jgi:ElaB/YqjD/DUF883 family membrane-anchored ribosome-binding protein
MMDQEQNWQQGYGTEGSPVNETVQGVRKNLNEAKDAITGQAIGLKDKLTEQTKVYGNQLVNKIDNARGKTSAGLRRTSDRINSLAMYVEAHDTRDISQALLRSGTDLVRKHPGKSLLAGVLLGLLLGRRASLVR